MSNTMSLSQQEIDELLNQTLTASGDTVSGPSPLSDIETDTLGEIGNISMGAAATALYTILGRQVLITTPQVSVTTLEELAADHLRPYVVVDVEYTEGFLGRSLFILQVDDVKIITDIMMGGEGTVSDEDLSDLHISAIAEAMNQMMGGMATSMADMFNRVVNISPPHSMIVELDGREIHELIDNEAPELIRISFKMEIEGLMDSSIMQLMPLRFGRQLVAGIMGTQEPAAAPKPAAPAQAADVQAPTFPTMPVEHQPPQPFTPPPYDPALHGPAGPYAQPYAQPGMPPYTQPYPGMPYGVPPTGGPQYMMPPYAPTQPEAPRLTRPQEPPVDARPVQLPSFDAPSPRTADSPEFGIGLIMDVPLQVTVELGQCRKTIKEILDLNTGSILTLDKMAGEPVDIVVHGKPVAKGEVIVIDESYGIRITEILTPPSRLLPGMGR